MVINRHIGQGDLAYQGSGWQEKPLGSNPVKPAMTSPSPLLYNTYYHIYNRGTNGEKIFIQERNYAHFLNLYAKHLEPVADLFAYCMLRNHFHVSVRVKSEEEILEYKKTLRVSSAISHPFKQSSPANQCNSQSEKPLGSPDFVSQKF